MTPIAFDMGIPDFDSLIIVTDIGPCQLALHYESGEVLLRMVGNRMFRVSGKHTWRYANY